MKRLFIWGSLISGVVAAYFMHRRGEPLVSIARKTMGNPVGALVAEVKNVL
jgi:hypothetical protein